MSQRHLTSKSCKRISLLISILCIVIFLTACGTFVPEKPEKSAQPFTKTLKPSSFTALPGWSNDDLREAWPAFIHSCEVLMKKPDWKEPCIAARAVDVTNIHAVRSFFEKFFAPYQVLNLDGAATGLITGYYEPLLYGARQRGGKYQTPLYSVPEDLLTIDLSHVYPDLKGMRLRGRIVGNKVVPYLSRAELVQSGALAGGELLWVDDPVEAFFLQVQGSGRVQLANTGEIVRVAYADQNGHPYKSIGRYLADRGELPLEQVSAQAIKKWYAAHPARQQELLNVNPSFVFFKEEKLIDPTKGPKGAFGVTLTPERSIAVDAQFVPLGAPVFLATTHPNSALPFRRLMLAQDTGGAIKSPVRADIFWGFGATAGEKAGKTKQHGMMWVLLPIGIIR